MTTAVSRPPTSCICLCDAGPATSVSAGGVCKAAKSATSTFVSFNHIGGHTKRVVPGEFTCMSLVKKIKWKSLVSKHSHILAVVSRDASQGRSWLRETCVGLTVLPPSRYTFCSRRHHDETGVFRIEFRNLASGFGTRIPDFGIRISEMFSSRLVTIFFVRKLYSVD